MNAQGAVLQRVGNVNMPIPISVQRTYGQSKKKLVKKMKNSKKMKKTKKRRSQKRKLLM